MSVSLETPAKIDERAQAAPTASSSPRERRPQPPDRLRIARGIVFGLAISLCLWLGIAMTVLWFLRGGP